MVRGDGPKAVAFRLGYLLSGPPHQSLNCVPLLKVQAMAHSGRLNLKELLHRNKI